MLGRDNKVFKTLQSRPEAADYIFLFASSKDELSDILDRFGCDCILCDLDQQDTNWLEISSHIKSTKSWLHIPVILYTSMENSEAVIAALHAGADDFVCKDYDHRVVFAKFKALLRVKSFQDELAQLRRVEGIKQIIATYNHEFNNPLTISIGNLNWLKARCTDTDQLLRFSRLEVSLQRMTDLVRKIRELRDYVEASYASGENMIDMNSSNSKSS